MITTFDIRLMAIQDNFKSDRDVLRYKRELKYLLEDIKRADKVEVMKTKDKEKLDTEIVSKDLAVLYHTISSNLKVDI